MNFLDNLAPKMIYGSYAVAGIVGVASILDMVIGLPFNGTMMMDIMFLLGSGLVGYMCYDAHKDLSSKS